MAKVSVIVPNYNHAAFLRQRIDSVLNQTFRDFELIVLDDCSTDGSRVEIERYRACENVRIYYNDVNGGSVFKQWNKGIQLATGEHIWIAESDDFADPKFLEVLIDLLWTNLNAGLAYCRSWLINEEGRVLKDSLEYTSRVDSERWRTDFVSAGPEECGRYLIQKNTIPNASAVLIRREALNRALPVDESFRVCGDWMAWARILTHSDIAYTSQALNYYRHHRLAVRACTSKAQSVKESLRVQAFIMRTVRVPPEIAYEIKMEAARRVKSTLLNRMPGLSLSLKAQIIGHALRINPLLFLEFFRRTPGGVKEPSGPRREKVVSPPCRAERNPRRPHSLTK